MDGGSQRLLYLNPTTVMVVLLFGLWLLLGCDNMRTECTSNFITILMKTSVFMILDKIVCCYEILYGSFKCMATYSVIINEV